MTERDIFLEALEMHDRVERAAYLDVACAGQPALRQEVEELLRSHQEAGDFLNVSAVEQLAAAEESLAFLEPPREPGVLGRLDHYAVLEVIGRGGTGVVLKARDTKLLRVVAIKALAPRLAASGTARQRFIREAQAAAAVRDDHVVAIHAVREDGPVPYLVMEYIDGITLEERVKQAGALKLTEVLRVGMQVANGLAAAHAPQTSTCCKPRWMNDLLTAKYIKRNAASKSNVGAAPMRSWASMKLFGMTFLDVRSIHWRSERPLACTLQEPARGQARRRPTADR
jgi:hypothetical protein